MHGHLTFGLLGPILAQRPGATPDPARPIELGEPRRRAVLGALLLDNGKSVRVDRLLALVWGSHPPESARKALQGYVSQLRRRLKNLPDVALETEPDGYQLCCPADSVDLSAFRSLVGQAQRETAPAARRALLIQATGYWRGNAFADAPREGLLAQLGRTLDEERCTALEDLYEAELRLGNEQQVIAALHGLFADYPLRERMAGLYMVALQRAGRRTEAVAVFPALRSRLVAETGLEPGRTLAALHRTILSGEAVLPPPAPALPADSGRDLLDSIGRLAAANLGALLDVGDGHLRKGDYDRALACYHAARALARDNADEPGAARATRGILQANADVLADRVGT